MPSNANRFNMAIDDYQAQLRGQQAGLGNQMGSNLAGINSGLGWYNRAVGETSMPDYVTHAADMTRGVMDQYANKLSGLFSNPGYTPQEKQGMGNAAVAPITSAYGTAQYQNNAGAARSGNAGASMANNAALARSKGRDMSTALSGLQGKFADARIAGMNKAFDASNLPVSYSQGALAGQQANTQLMQFPSTLNATMYGQNLGAQQNTLEQQGNVSNMLLQRAQKPGFLAQAGLAAIGGITSPGH